DRQEQEWRESLRTDQDRLLTELQRLTGEKALTVARRLLADMADRSLEEAVVRGLAQRVGETSEEDRTAVRTALAASDGAVVVRSAVELSAAGRQEVTAAVAVLAGGADRPLAWEPGPALIGGGALRVGARAAGSPGARR